MPEITSPTSSLSYSALDTLLKGKAPTSDTGAPFVPYSKDAKDETSRAAEISHSYPLVMTNTSTNRHSLKSLTNPVGSKGADQTTIEKPRFPSISPCPSIEASSSSSSDSSSSSPTARWRRSPSPESRPTMVIQSTLSTHSLSVVLPRAIQSEMVTVSVKKGDKLNIVADAWHMENDCKYSLCIKWWSLNSFSWMLGHYEWQVHFAPGDADMPSVRARFAPDGKLTITVQRRIPGQTSGYSRGPLGTRF